MPKQQDLSSLLAHATDFTCQYPGPDLFGQIREARLQLKCFPIIKEAAMIRLLHANPMKLAESLNQTVFDREKYRDIRDEVYCLQIECVVETLYRQTSEQESESENEDERSDNTSEEYIGGDTMEVRNIYGLLLKLEEGKGKGTFSRVGAFGHTFDGAEYFWLRQLQKSSSKDLLDGSLYQEAYGPDEDGLKQFLITLV